ncbi:MAG: phage tail tube protein [Bacteroidaceae bacterium]|nr:phage tail tube protein [Bacteroidaceae bacterium]
MVNTMSANDVIKGSMAKCYVTIDGNRYNFAHAISLEATMEKNKATVPVLGKTGKHNVPSGWEGSGSMTLHYNSSIMREMLYKYKETGQETYFEIQVENEAPGSNVGNQTVILKQCTLDGGILAKFDADADYLDEDVDFTFDDFEIPQKFATQD